MNARTCTFDHVYAKAETSKALLCFIAGDELWVPKSQISADSEVQHRGDHGRLVVTRWWARKAELVEDAEDDDRERAYDAPAVIELTEASRIYRRLALEHHPDRAGGDGTTMRAVNILWDAVKVDVGRAANGRRDS
jgi:hypothetical protein